MPIGSVSRLHLAHLPDETFGYFRAGDLSAVIELTRRSATPEELALRGRAFVRMGLLESALAALEGEADSWRLPAKVERSLVRASALGKLGRIPEGRDAMLDARAFALSSPHPSLEMDVYVHDAMLGLMANDLGLARHDITAALTLGDRPRLHPSDAEPLWDEMNVMARAHEQRARLAGIDGDTELQRESFSQALTHLRASKDPDVWLEANLCANFALVLSEEVDTAPLALVRASADAIAWTPDLALQRFVLQRSFAISASLAGDHVSAFRFYREAARVAPTKIYRLLAMVDRLLLSRELGQSRDELLCDDLAAISDAAAEIAWTSAIGEEYVVLLLLAQLFAPYDVDRASNYYERYIKFHAGASKDLAGRFHPRRQAHQAHVFGVISLQRGDIDVAVASLERAFDTYEASGCDWSAAEVALDLAQLSNRADVRALLADAIARIPHSWIARRANEDLAQAARRRLAAVR